MALLLITEREIDDTCQNTGWVDMVQFYMYLGVHINNRLDRTTNTYCTRGGRILFKTVLFFAVVCKGENSRVKDAGRMPTILDNISLRLYADIQHLLKHPKVATSRSLDSHLFHPPTDSFISKWPLVSANWEGVEAGRLYCPEITKYPELFSASTVSGLYIYNHALLHFFLWTYFCIKY